MVVSVPVSGIAFEPGSTILQPLLDRLCIDCARCIMAAAGGARVGRFAGLFHGIGGCLQRQCRPARSWRDLGAIMVIALCTVLCGRQSASDTSLAAREKEAFLHQFLKVERGVPKDAQHRACCTETLCVDLIFGLALNLEAGSANSGQGTHAAPHRAEGMNLICSGQIRLEGPATASRDDASSNSFTSAPTMKKLPNPSFQCYALHPQGFGPKPSIRP